LVTGVYTRRLNRFLTLVSLNGRAVLCFLPNPGRMEELLVPRVKVVLREAEGKHRKTRYELLAVYQDDLLVSVDTRIPNRLLFEAFKERRLDPFSHYDVIKPEYVYGQSRFDFLLRNNVERCLIEAKSCTLVRRRPSGVDDTYRSWRGLGGRGIGRASSSSFKELTSMLFHLMT